MTVEKVVRRYLPDEDVQYGYGGYYEVVKNPAEEDWRQCALLDAVADEHGHGVIVGVGTRVRPVFSQYILYRLEALT